MPPAWHERRRGPSAAAEPYPESDAVGAALDAWRHKASNIALAVMAAAQLPVVVLGFYGYGPPVGRLLKGLALAVYLVLVAGALLPRLGYRPRLLACFLVAYPALAGANLVIPEGPYAQVGVVTLPIFALVLLGAPAARVAILASLAIVLSVPLLRVQPSMMHALGLDPAQVADPWGLVWFRMAVKAASLLGLMVLLDRFHRFLADALTAQFRAKADVEREAAELFAAHQKIEGDLRQRQQLERELAAAGDAERRRLGQELHDGVCQQVTAALLRCQALERRLQRRGPLSAEDFAALSSLLTETIDETHNVARGLCPLEPDAEALAPALRALTRRTQEMAGTRCEFRAAGKVSVPDAARAQHLYRIAQEALSNAVRHASASRIILELRGSDDELLLQVEDDGVGLPPQPSAGGMGLRTMAYRAEILAGELTVTAAPGGGTRVACRVPHPMAPSQAGEKVADATPAGYPL